MGATVHLQAIEDDKGGKVFNVSVALSFDIYTAAWRDSLVLLKPLSWELLLRLSSVNKSVNLPSYQLPVVPLRVWINASL